MMKNDTQRYSVYAVIGILVVAISFFGGYYIRAQQTSANEHTANILNKERDKPAGVDFSPYWKAWNILEEKFVPATSSEAVTDQEKVWGAIQGLAQSYDDPYTVFLPPQESEVFQENISGSFGGVGMEIGIRDEVLTVVSPLKGTPADEAGLQPGDQIVKINGESTQDISVDEAVQKIRGEKGTAVTLTIAREGRSELFDVEIVRSTISIPTIETTLRDDGVFVIELYNFSAQAADKFRNALRDFVDADTDKLIIDLRGNAGGYLSHAVDISSWFLPAGKAVVREEVGGHQEERVHRSRGYNIFNENLELAILVNRGTASASEIVAGALREHDKATLVGTQTFGKGSVQELVDITPETSLKVTVARWLTPEGVSISKGGLTPDVVVEMTQEDRDAGRDPQLQRAIEIVKEGS